MCATKTTVILLNYNNQIDTEICIKSLKKYSPNLKIVVVDNNSTGNEIDIVCKKFNDITLLKNPTNIGFGRGNNIGIRWSLENTKSKYILILNNDTYVKDDSIGILENFMDNNSKIAGCSARIVFAENPNVIWYGGGALNWKRGGAISDKMRKPFNGDLTNKKVDFITGCCMMIRLDFLKKIGGFDPRYFMYYEDVELCARIKKNHGRLFFVPNSVIYHRVHGSIRKDHEKLDAILLPHLPFYIEHSFCNVLLTFTKYANNNEKIWGSMYLAIRWFRNIIVYIMNRRFEAITALYRSVKRFFYFKKKIYYDELS
ncbi:MAG: glycosyltransferase family 2 protein [Pseudomonadota bacterium]